MDSLRTPFLIVALILGLIIVLIEAGSLGFIGNIAHSDLSTPGLGVPYLALMDGILLFTIGMFGLAVIVPAPVLGAVQGIITFIVMLLLLLSAIGLIFVAVTLLTLMVTLLLAVPFGTIAYFAAFADFDTDAARITLGVIMTLKIALVIFLVLAQQQFIEVKGLVLLILTSFLVSIVVSFLHGLVPGFLVSIVDAIAAIVVGVIAAIWALIKLIGSIPGIVKGLRISRHVT